MTRKQLIARVEHWRVQIAPEWRITIVDEPWDDDAMLGNANATTEADEEYQHARMWFRKAHRKKSPLGELDVTIVHEILHLLCREQRYVVDLVKTNVSEDFFETLRGLSIGAEERLVDRLARIIVRTSGVDGIVYGVTTDE